jgi:CHASE1-domain containing sensor protein
MAGERVASENSRIDVGYRESREPRSGSKRADNGEVPANLQGGQSRGRGVGRIWPLVLTLVLGIILPVGASLSTWKWEQKIQTMRFTQDARDLVHLLRDNIKDKLIELQGIASFCGTSEEVSRNAFLQFVAPYLSYLHFSYDPSIQALEWIPRVPGKERRRYEEMARREGLPDFQITENNAQGQMVRAGERKEYFPVYFVDPYLGNEKALGYDLASDPIYRKEMLFSQEFGAPASMATMRLTQEPGNQRCLLMFLPVYQRNAPLEDVEQREAALRGFVLGVFRIKDLVANSFKGLTSRNLKIYLVDEMAPEGEKFILEFSLDSSRALADEGSARGIADVRTGLHHKAAVEVGNRFWTVLIKPESEGKALSQVLLPLVVLLVGLGITGILVAMRWKIWWHTAPRSWSRSTPPWTRKSSSTKKPGKNLRKTMSTSGPSWNMFRPGF